MEDVKKIHVLGSPKGSRGLDWAIKATIESVGARGRWASPIQPTRAGLKARMRDFYNM